MYAEQSAGLYLNSIYYNHDQLDANNIKEYKEKLNMITNHMEKEHKLFKKDHFVETYIPIGMCFGVTFGILFNNLSIGISFGLLLGFAIGYQKDEEAYICQKPWTRDIGDFTRKIVKERVKVNAGQPLFTLILLDCEVIVYLDISDELLAEHCKKRESDFHDAKNVKAAIENTWNSHRENNDKIFYYLNLTE